MAQVTNINIHLQEGTTNSFFATWDFNETTKTTSSAVKQGDIVGIISGATYYNGVKVPSEVLANKWYVHSISGNRAVIHKKASGSSGWDNIMSPIHTKYLTGGSGTEVSSNTLDHYEVSWAYYTGNKDAKGENVWFSGGSSNVTKKQSDIYSPPENAHTIRVSVKPVSKTYKQGDKDVSHWTGTYAYKWYGMRWAPPNKPPKPSVSIEKYKLTASVEDITDGKADQILFQLYNGNKHIATATVNVATARASHTWDVSAGGKYRVRCQAINTTEGVNTKSDWSDYSEEKTTIPPSVSNVNCAADSESSVKVTWTGVTAATGYDIQYTKDVKYFDTTSGISSTSVEGTTAYVTGLESGQKWYFRVRAKNDQGESGWSNPVSTIIGTEPEPPTTWSLTNTVVVGNDVTLYWVHNTEDGSKQTEAQIQLIINGNVSTVTVPGIADEDEPEPIYSYTFGTSDYSEGAQILWKVRTKGIISKWSDWSTQRTIDLNAPPTLNVSVSTNEEGVLTTLPLDISAFAGPSTQKPISYHVAVIAKETYTSVDNIGSDVIIAAGTELYSKVFNVSDREFTLSLSAGDIILGNGQTYELSVLVSMNSGLTAQTSVLFNVDWETYAYIPDASIAIDKETLCAYITPFCKDQEGNLVTDATLSVYRREYDGTFTELITGLANTGVDTITDPHPALDYARYRIVAQHTTTGSIGYEDLPGQPVGESSIVIQWDEQWSNYDYTEESEPETPSWTGSMLRLRYNIDITENRDPDVELVEYIGRENPVSYFGTQKGESGNWSAAIDKTDKETIYALRRLQAWRGNAYVREPSGTGYWAHIKVSFPIKHDDLTVPVSLTVTRVEGDI